MIVDRMNALSLWQPWGSLFFVGPKAKRVETRDWATKIRGEIAIHAAATKQGFKLIRAGDSSAYDLVVDALQDAGYHLWSDLPLGAVLGSAVLVDCVPIEALYGSEYDTPVERAFGDWSPGRYGWIVERAVRYPEPIFAPGAQGIWKWSPPEGVIRDG